MNKWKLGMLWAILFVAHTAIAEDITITDEAGLRALATAVNGGASYNNQTIYLANDIALTGGVWTPIGTEDKPFKGHFEGWGHKISGLTITGNNNYQGLFGYIEGGSVRDVAVVGSSSITGGQFAGAICGCLNGGEISSCYSEVSVKGTTDVGGICGSSSGKVMDCYVTGLVTSETIGEVNVGGIVGLSSGTLQNCYMSGTMSVAGNWYYGAIVGHHQSGTLQHCIFNTETIGSGTFSAIGGHNDYTPAHNDNTNKVTGASTTDMQTKTEEKDFWASILDYSAWKMVNGSYPLLYSFLKNEPITFTFTRDKNWLTIVPNGNYAVPEGMEAYIVTAVDDGDSIVILTRVYTLNEGRGALLFCETGADREFTATATNGPLSDYSRDTWLKGSHVSPATIGGEGHYDYILQNGVFRRARSGSLARCKAYLHLGDHKTGQARRDFFNIQFDNETTNLFKMKSNETRQSASAYDLNGRRVQAMPKHGLIIQNGKKTMKQ